MKTLKKAIVSIIYFGIILGLNSQNNTQLNDSLMQKSFDELVVLFYSNKNTPDKALNYVNAYFKKALIKRDTMKMLEGKYILSQVKENDSIFLNFCDSLIHLTSKKPSKNFPVCFYLEKNRFFYHKGKFNKALKELTFVNSHLDKHPNDSILHLYYVRLALLKGYFEKTEEAIDLYKKAYHYAEQKKIVNTDDFISTLPNLAANYSQ